MSVRSQENNMRRLAALLSRDLGYIHGERECGPNGSKKAFLNIGRTFLRALGKDLGLHDVLVSSNPGGIAVSGECTLMGMWESNGIYLELSRPACGSERVLCYRTVRNIRDFKGGYNRYLTRADLLKMSYPAFLELVCGLRKDGGSNERAA